MGLFDSLFGSVETGTKLTPQDAFAGILMCATACDGHIADDEAQSLGTTLVRMKLYQRQSEKQFGQMLEKLYGSIKKRGVEEMVNNCAAALPAELRDVAFCNACDIVLADGTLEQDERDFIHQLQAKLAIPNDRAREIVEIMVVKNKG